ncbi:MAG: fumarylacetoacetate hydrolase family protein [Candidatus Thermoplasmatota archaeon]|nr:fumarylacetoacetate hydrolase family protein [Candidatus Thermoplasmatota archaeon]
MLCVDVSGGSELDIAPSKIICLIKSYASHAEEMNGKVSERPIFFLKPPSSLLPNGGVIEIPYTVNKLHHEIELAVIIGKTGRSIPLEEASMHIGHYIPMLDITARDLQGQAKKSGLPWSEAKGFDTFAPLGPEAVPSKGFRWRGRRIWLDVNGERRQDSNTDLLLFSVDRIVADLSMVMTLEKGDIIMTGTPAGVGPLHDGDRIKAGIDGFKEMEFTVSNL